MRSRLARTTLASAALSMLSALPSAALTIDNFEEGAINVVDTNLNDSLTGAFAANGEQTGSTANIVGGVRLVTAVATDLPAPDLADIPDPSLLLPIPPLAVPGTASAQLPAPLPVVDDGVLFTAVGGGGFRLVYDGLPGGNLASGMGGALDLDLSPFNAIVFQAQGVTGTAAQARLRLASSTQSQGSPFVPIIEGANLLSLIGFTLNLPDIQQVTVDIRGISAGSQLQLLNLEAVPEPGTALLVGAGLVAMAAIRRRSAR